MDQENGADTKEKQRRNNGRKHADIRGKSIDTILHDVGECRYHEETDEYTESEGQEEREGEVGTFHSEEEEEYTPAKCTGGESADNGEDYM